MSTPDQGMTDGSMENRQARSVGDLEAQPARILLFTGEGKGKTTAAMGLALRAAGHGLRVRIIQFIKNDPTTGEVAVLTRLPNVRLSQSGRGFVPLPTDLAFSDHRRAAEGGLAMADHALVSGDWDVLILDELCVAVAKALLDGERVAGLLRRVPTGMVLVLTGRGATPALIELADTVTEMRLVKHAYQRGRRAQRGVEL